MCPVSINYGLPIHILKIQALGFRSYTSNCTYLSSALFSVMVAPIHSLKWAFYFPEKPDFKHLLAYY